MKLKIFTFNPVEEHTYIVSDDTGECAIIDAGCLTKEEQDSVVAYIEKHELTPKFLLNTHCHFDHIFGIEFLQEKYKIPFLAHEKDSVWLKEGTTFAQMFGIQVDSLVQKIDKTIDEGDVIEVGNLLLKVLHVPGHCEGHVVFFIEKEGYLFTGDVLFKGSIGRTDFLYGNQELLLQGIKEKLFILPDKTHVHAGHGLNTTIGEEKKYNPYLQ